MLPVVIFCILLILGFVYKLVDVISHKPSNTPDEKTKQLITSIVKSHREQIKQEVREELRIELKEELRQELLIDSQSSKVIK